MVDRDAFLFNPFLSGNVNVYKLTPASDCVVLTLAPGLVVCYDRNKITLDLLDKAGIEVRTFEGAELSRGRGGARCMSMPIIREAL